MFKTTYKCTDCNREFSKITKNLPKKDHACPHCKEVKKVKFKGSVSDKTHDLSPDSRVLEMNTSHRAPSVGGTNNMNKALDLAAKICMEDQNMTDINIGGNLREGDNCAPKLSHEQEAKVDNMFKQQKPIMGMQHVSNMNKALISQINSGRYASQSGPRDIAERAKNSGYVVPTNIIYEHGREQPANSAK